MKRALVVLMILALAAPAFGALGMNPGIRGFISFRPNCPTETYPTDPYVHSVVWAGEKTYNAYFMLDCFGNTLPPPDPALLGCRGVMFKWVTVPSDPSFPPDVMAALYYPTGTQVIGGPDQDKWVLAWPDCWLATVCSNGTKIMKVFRQGYYCYNPLKITILPNAVDGKLVVDCLYGENQFCVLANGGIGIAPDPGDLGCNCPPPQSAVESASWGSIKSLYR
jgi:hypothetical protein